MPPYPYSRSGTVLVCGSAWTLQDDYAGARELYPQVPVIAVKDAAQYIKAFAVFGCHPRKMPRCVRLQKALHEDFEVHMGGNLRDRTRLGHIIDYTPDYRWPEAVGGSSGWAARKMAAMMGFETVILCGIPLSAGGYCGGKPAIAFQNEPILERYRREVMSDTHYHCGVFSMSGWTREMFGAPA